MALIYELSFTSHSNHLIHCRSSNRPLAVQYLRSSSIAFGFLAVTPYVNRQGALCSALDCIIDFWENVG